MPSQSFSYTGAFQTFVVPDDVYVLTFDGQGAQGGRYVGGTSSPGGKGGRVVCDVPVVPGETLRVYVGGEGLIGVVSTIVAGGFNGGGTGRDGGGSGGGGTDLRRSPYTIYDAIAGAGGGGGSSSDTSITGQGGYGGYPAGLGGQIGRGTSRGDGGGGAARAGGLRGLLQNAGTSGSAGQGGNGGAGSSSGAGARGAGGGGGGWFGGGGAGGGSTGSTGGGGGGGCGLSTGVNETITNDTNTGDGEATLTWTVDPEPGFDEHFVYTGAFEEVVVPVGVTLATINAYGAEGSGPQLGFWSSLTLGTATQPGKGGRVQCDVVVTPGETLRVYVGGRGLPASGVVAGGFNGGGSSGSGAGAGGGATDIRTSPFALADRLMVAPGGGGGGQSVASSAGSVGGGGGTPTGTDGTGGDGSNPGHKGFGGTSSAGGAGGSGTAGADGTAGSLGTGGDGGTNAGHSGGGGGAGLYGGGGGEASTTGGGAGAGGGSGESTGVNETITDNTQPNHGYLTITWGSVTCPDPPDLRTGADGGGTLNLTADIELSCGEPGDGLAVWVVADDGGPEPDVTAAYQQDGSFDTSHPMTLVKREVMADADAVLFVFAATRITDLRRVSVVFSVAPSAVTWASATLDPGTYTDGGEDTYASVNGTFTPEAGPTLDLEATAGTLRFAHALTGNQVAGIVMSK